MVLTFEYVDEILQYYYSNKFSSVLHYYFSPRTIWFYLGILQNKSNKILQNFDDFWK